MSNHFTNDAASSRSPRRVGALRFSVVVVALTYALLGGLGLLLAIPPGYASPVFPAAGFALAVTLLFGPGMLPRIWLGSLTLNIGVALSHGNLSVASALVAAGIATGAMLQAWAGHALVRSWSPEKWRRLEHERDATYFLVLGGLLACLVSATVGVSSLVGAGIVTPVAFGYAWWNWYVGDTLGVLLAAPLTLGLLQRHDPAWRERLKAMALPMFGILALAGAAFFGSARWEAGNQQAQIDDQGQTVAHDLDFRFVAHREALASLVRIIEITPDLGPAQFEHFTEATLRDQPDVSALSFNPYVTRAQRAGFERRMAAISPGGRFEITERDAQRRLVRAGDRPDYVTVSYIQPLAGNLPAIGFDIHSEPMRRDAIERARRSRNAAATVPIRLVQEAVERPGVLVLSPAYRDHLAANGHKVSDLIGFAVAVIKVDEMVEIATHGRLAPGLVIELDDMAAEPSRRALYRTQGVTPIAAGMPTWTTHLLIADREWELRVVPTGAYIEQHRPWLAWGIGVLGLLFAALVQTMLLAVTGRAALVRRRVDEQTVEIRAQSEALAKSEERYRSVVDNLKEVVFQTDAQGLWTFLNPAWTEVTGFPVQDSLGKLFLDYVHPDDRQRNTELFEPLIQRKKEYCRHEVRYLHKDGGFRWIEVFARLTLDRNGDIVGTSGTLMDVTERRRVEAALQHAQAVAHIGSWELDVRNNRLVWSDETHRIFGIPLDTTLTLDRFLAGVHPDDRERVAAAWNAALSGAPYHIEHRIVVAGETLWVSERAEVKFDQAGQAVYALGTVQDITESKRAAHLLEEERGRFSDFSASSADWFWEMDSDLRFCYFSANFESMYGLKAERLLGKTRAELFAQVDLNPPDHVAAHLADLQAHRPFRNFEYRVRDSAGEIRWISVSGIPVRTADGRFRGYRGVGQIVTQHKLAEQALRASEERFRTLADFNYDWEYWRGPDHEFIYMSPACERITGYSAVEFSADQTLMERIVHPDDRERVEGHLRDYRDDTEHALDFRIIRKDGGIRWIAHGCRGVFGPDGEFRGRRVSNRDVTDRKWAETELSHARESLALALEATSLSIWDFDITTGTVLLDSHWAIILGGFAVETMTSVEALARQVHFDDMPRVAQAAASVLKGSSAVFQEEFRFRTPSGTWKWIRCSGKVSERSADGRATRAIGTNLDISDRKAAEEEIQHWAFFDRLTNLPNRRLLEDRLQQKIARARREKQRLSLLFIDLDRFKPINDELGHEVGDWLLQQVSERMVGCLRQSDTVARVGGDEFVVLLPNAQQGVDALSVGEKIREALEEPFPAPTGRALSISCSIGVALYPDHAEDLRGLFRCGDEAMYRAKKGGRNAVELAISERAGKDTT